LNSFEFSDYSDNDNFEDSKETQNSSDVSSDNDDDEVSVPKRQASSPIGKEDFKRHKKSSKSDKNK